MKFTLQIPLKFNVDNKVEIFISQNPTFKRTKNINTRYHFIRQYIKDVIISIEFIQKDKKKSDIMKKNFSIDNHQ